MQQSQVTAMFDERASSYDQNFSKFAPITEARNWLTSIVLSTLPPNANILCVGAGTGAEILYLAKKFPEWCFTAVEPSTAMHEVLRRRAGEHGILSRCVFHHGYLDTLPPGGPFDAATAFLVSHFIMERDVRSGFFQSIAARLSQDGILVCADMAGDMSATNYRDLLDVWIRVTTGVGTPTLGEDIEKMRDRYTRDVAVLPPSSVSDIITLGGFETPALFFQAGLTHAWFAKRSQDTL